MFPGDSSVVIHEEGWGCEHGFSSDLCTPWRVPGAWRSWGPSLGLSTRLPQPAAHRTPHRAPGPAAALGAFISLWGRSRAASQRRSRQRPNGPGGTRGAVLAERCCGHRQPPHLSLRAVPAGQEKAADPDPTPGPAGPRLRDPNRVPSAGPDPAPPPPGRSQSAAAAASGARAPCRSRSAMAEVSAEPPPGSRRARGRSRPGGDTGSPELRLPGAARARPPAAARGWGGAGRRGGGPWAQGRRGPGRQRAEGRGPGPGPGRGQRRGRAREGAPGREPAGKPGRAVPARGPRGLTRGKGLRARGCGTSGGKGRAERPGGRADREPRVGAQQSPVAVWDRRSRGQGSGAVGRGSQRLSGEGRPEQWGSAEVRMLGMGESWGKCREGLVWVARMVLNALPGGQKARGAGWGLPAVSPVATSCLSWCLVLKCFCRRSVTLRAGAAFAHRVLAVSLKYPWPVVMGLL